MVEKGPNDVLVCFCFASFSEKRAWKCCSSTVYRLIFLLLRYITFNALSPVARTSVWQRE